MKNTSRRSFLKKISVGGVTATVLTDGLVQKDAKAKTLIDSNENNAKEKKTSRDYNGTYQEEFLNRVAFPIGGLGSGMFCLEGTGAISHMSISFDHLNITGFL